MSDYFNKDSRKSNGQHSGANPWQQDPFAAYDDPSINPSGTGAPLEDAGQEGNPYARPAGRTPDYSAWRRPDEGEYGEDRYDAQDDGQNYAQQDASAARPDFAASQNPYGGMRSPYAPQPPREEEADYGIVSAQEDAASHYAGYSAAQQQVDNSFAAMGADAPTRIARPAMQVVSKHKSTERSAAAQQRMPAQTAADETPAREATASAEGGAPRRRRVSRAARYEETPETEQSAPVAARPAMEGGFAAPRDMQQRPRSDFDPFEAGDSEAAPEREQPEPMEESMPANMGEERPQRRPAAPGERYTGARTAMPQSGAPMRRNQVGELGGGAPQRPRPEGQMDDMPERRAMPPQGQRPMHPEADGRPVAPQGQRPMQLDDDGRPVAPQGQRPMRMDANGRPIPPQGQQRPVQLDANGRPVPPQGQRPVRLDADGRPIPPQGQRPVQLDANGRPVPPQGQRPRLDANGRPIAPQGQRPQGMPPQQQRMAPRDAEESAYDPRRRMLAEDEQDVQPRFDPRRAYPEEQPRASVERPAYDFEDDMDEEDDRPRRGGFLIPLLVVLLIIGGLIAGIMLPDWDGMGGGLGTAMGKIKGAIMSIISPEQPGVKSFSVSPQGATAPVELVFSVQASPSITSVRIVDRDGVELLSKTLTDQELLGGEVTKNSNVTIWTLRYTYDTAYEGTFTAQTLQKDGTWDEGMPLAQVVSIAAPIAAEPPVQEFVTDITEGTVPSPVGFTVVTSKDVTAVQIVNDYGDAVVEAYLSENADQVVEGANTRTWNLSTEIENAYAGSFFAAYETDSDITFTQSDYRVNMDLSTPEPQAEETPDPAAAASLSSLGGEDLIDANLGADELIGDVAGVDAAGDAANAGDAAGDAVQPEVPAETVVPEATPEPTPLPILTAAADESADPKAIKLSTKIYEETKVKDTYERSTKVVLNDPFKYAIWDQSGVLTFRGDGMRQNAAYGTVNIQNSNMTELWKVAVDGNIKAKSATLTGIAWPGQPIIVKWPTQLRNILAINDESKGKAALKEVIIGAQNGKIYFLDLVTGELTREPIANEWPSNGVMSLQTNSWPMLAVGQHIGVLAKKTVDNGLHLYNLLNNKELTLIKGKDKQMRTNYSGVNSAPLFDKTSGSMIFGGENGLLYTMETAGEFDHMVGTLKISPSIQKYQWLATKQKAKNTNIDGAVAMYGPYAYFADQSGIVQCVDINTMTPVWAVNTGDNVDATIALDMENESTVALYTANTILTQGRNGVATIRRLDALTGAQDWAFEIPELVYTTEAEVGIYASPVVGQNSVSDLVYFTVSRGTQGATLYALTKSSGSVKWSLELSSPTLSSPVAVYNDEGKAWIIQSEGSGLVHMIDAQTGTDLKTMQLEGKVESSPAVYRDVLVIGTTGSDTSFIYGIKLD